MKLLLLVCVSLVAGSPVLQKRSLPTSVYDYYDFVEIPRIQPMASSRSDGPVLDPVASMSGPLPRRIPLPLPPKRPVHHSVPKKRAPFSGPRPQLSQLRREPDYQLAEAAIIPQQYRPRPKPKTKQQPRARPVFQPRPQNQQPIRQPEPQFYDYSGYEEEPFYPADESVFVDQPQYPREIPLYQEDVLPQFQEERRPQFQEKRRPQFQEERRPQFQEERRPQFQEERLPQYQEERRPNYQEERLPQYQEELRPEYQEESLPDYQKEILPVYQEERLPVYQEERLPQYQEERPPYYEEEELPLYEEEESDKDFNRPPLNNYPTTLEKDTDSVKEKRDAVHGGGHLDENGLKFAADAAAVENAKGSGRLAFQIHGQQGPHSYRFGYDTGKGHNRQFRYEERDGDGLVHGRYGFHSNDGKLQVVNYSAHPEHGFSADVPKQ